VESCKRKEPGFNRLLCFFTSPSGQAVELARAARQLSQDGLRLRPVASEPVAEAEASTTANGHGTGQST
jgi:hypothetical protein